jgi:MSHA pilin protein MshD
MCIEANVTNVGWAKRSVPNEPPQCWARCALPNQPTTRHLQQGVSLIEAVMFIVVVSVALVVVLKAFDIANQGSADPLLRRQSLAIAQSLLDEISFKDFANPVGGYSGTAGNPNEAQRSQFDDAMDYDGFDQTDIHDLNNATLTGLENYRVQVSVLPAAFGSVPETAGYRITVTVTDPANNTLTLDGYRADY